MATNKPTNITANDLYQSLLADIEELSSQFNGIFGNNLKESFKHSEVLLTNYAHQSKDMINDILLNEEQYPTAQAKFVAIVEIYDKMLNMISESTSKIKATMDEYIITASKKQASLSVKHQLIILIRELEGVFTETKYVVEIMDELMNDLNIKSIKDVNWEELQREVALERAIAILKETENSGQHIDFNRMKPKDRAIFMAAKKKLDSQPKIEVVKNSIS